MDHDDSYLLIEPQILLVALRIATDGAVAPEDGVQRLQESLGQAGFSIPADALSLADRLSAAYDDLHRVGLVRRDGDGRFTTTQRGIAVIEANPHGLDASATFSFPELRALVRRPVTYRGQGISEEPANEYEDGYAAGLTGKPLTDNPHSFDSIAHLEWENGWCEALDELQKSDREADGE